jgi:GNAT superfamily N-acetyltransferase
LVVEAAALGMSLTIAPRGSTGPARGRGVSRLAAYSPPESMGDLKIRAAVEAEVDAALELYQWLFEPSGYTPQYWEETRAREALSEAIEAEYATVLVAESGVGGLVGLITVYLDLNSVRYGQRAWVEDLAVDPSHRSAGIGKALLDGAKAWATKRRATHLELDTGLSRNDAQRFYEREGPIAKGYSYSWALQ